MKQIDADFRPAVRTGKVMNWASILEDNTRTQAEMTSVMPFIHPHLALMPDAHLGKGATVGSVIPTLGAIIPAAVGVDIGCGMIAVRTQYTLSDLPAREDYHVLREAIEHVIPLSAGKYNEDFYDGRTDERLKLLEGLAESYWCGFEGEIPCASSCGCIA